MTQAETPDSDGQDDVPEEVESVIGECGPPHLHLQGTQFDLRSLQGGRRGWGFLHPQSPLPSDAALDCCGQGAPVCTPPQALSCLCVHFLCCLCSLAGPPLTGLQGPSCSQGL